MLPQSIPLHSPRWLADPANVGRLELAKWLAFAAMVLDHVDLLLFSRGIPWMHAVGQFAFPFFCLSFGLGLAQTRNAHRVALRTLAAGMVAQVAWFVAKEGGHHPANMLLVFGCTAALVFVYSRAPRLAVFALLGVGLYLAHRYGEGSIAAPVLVLCGLAAGTRGSWWPVLVAGALWLVLAPSLAAFLAVLAVVAWPAWWPTGHRLPGALLWAYPGHLFVLGALALAIR